MGNCPLFLDSFFPRAYVDIPANGPNSLLHDRRILWFVHKEYFDPEGILLHELGHHAGMIGDPYIANGHPSKAKDYQGRVMTESDKWVVTKVSPKEKVWFEGKWQFPSDSMLKGFEYPFKWD